MSLLTYKLIDKRLNELDRGLDYKAPIFGVYWDKASSPVLTRTHDAVGMSAAIGIDGQWVQNDFDGAPIFGQIGDVKDDLGNVFCRIPRLYIRKTDGPDFKTWAVTTRPLPGFYLPWVYYDFTKNKSLLYYDHGKYKGSLSQDGKLESKAGMYPLVNKNIVEFRNYAQANGKGYQQLDIHAVDIIQTLFFIEFATLHSQSIMQGFTSGQYDDTHTALITESGVNRIVVDNAVAGAYRIGQAISVGSSRGNNSVFYGRTITDIQADTPEVGQSAIVFDGDPVDITLGDCVYNTGWKNGFSANIAASSGCIGANDGKYPCVYRGIESPFGDIWQFVDGVNITDHQAWVCANAENYASNVFADPYKQLGYINSNTNGYVSEMGYDPDYPFAEFPTAVAGKSDTYYSDYYYQSTGQRIARVGGSWSNGSAAGLSYWSLDASSSSALVYVGGRLLKKPL